MNESKMNGLKRSQVLKIEAAVVEIMENANFIVTENVSVNEGSTSGTYRMSFVKSEKSKLEDLISIQDNFGENFNISIAAKDKKNFCVIIEAQEEDFIKLI